MQSNLTLIKRFQWALEEDCPTEDITTQLLVPEEHQSDAQLIAKAKGVFCGQSVISVAATLFPNLQFDTHCRDGAPLETGTIIAQISGPLSDILKCERVLLNFLQRLSGIATLTHQYVSALNDPNIHILDTRKTTPLYRDLEKQAVLAGEGHNHRMGLSDMVLIKENHFRHLSEQDFNLFLTQQLSTFKHLHPHTKIELEIETIDQLNALDIQHVDIILLDNFPIDQISKAVELTLAKHPHIEFEISGNVSLDTISRYKGLPIQRISIGALTHSVPSLDLSLLVKELVNHA